jgi:hypothetical protein
VTLSLSVLAAIGVAMLVVARFEEARPMTFGTWIGIGLVIGIGVIVALEVAGFIRGRSDVRRLVDALVIGPAVMVGCVGLALRPRAGSDATILVSLLLAAGYLGWRAVTRKPAVR